MARSRAKPAPAMTPALVRQILKNNLASLATQAEMFMDVVDQEGTEEMLELTALEIRRLADALVNQAHALRTGGELIEEGR